MSDRIDDLDRKILAELQADASQSLDEIARKVGSSKTPVWNRIKRMKETGVITRQTAILDPEALGLEACFSCWCARLSMRLTGSAGFWMC